MSNRTDIETLLAEMARLADEAGDWRDHLVFEEIVNWQTDDAIRRKFIGHVRGCQYCQEAIDLFRTVGFAE